MKKSMHRNPCNEGFSLYMLTIWSVKNCSNKIRVYIEKSWRKKSWLSWPKSLKIKLCEMKRMEVLQTRSDHQRTTNILAPRFSRQIQKGTVRVKTLFPRGLWTLFTSLHPTQKVMDRLWRVSDRDHEILQSSPWLSRLGRGGPRLKTEDQERILTGPQDGRKAWLKVPKDWINKVMMLIGLN